MNAEKLMKETYSTIEFEDKWDYLTQRFSADDMIHFAELYAQKQSSLAESNNGKLPITHVDNLSKFCQKISKQEDCPPEFIEIVNKEFWNLI